MTTQTLEAWTVAFVVGVGAGSTAAEAGAVGSVHDPTKSRVCTKGSGMTMRRATETGREPGMGLSSLIPRHSVTTQKSFGVYALKLESLASWLLSSLGTGDQGGSDAVTNGTARRSMDSPNHCCVTAALCWEEEEDGRASNVPTDLHDRRRRV